MKTSVIACVTSVTPIIASAGTVHAKRLGDGADLKSLQQKRAKIFDVPSTNYKATSRTLELGCNAGSGCQGQPGPKDGYMLDGNGISLVDGPPPPKLNGGTRCSVG